MTPSVPSFTRRGSDKGVRNRKQIRFLTPLFALRIDRIPLLFD
jgi:hypothetical protein